MSIFIDFWMVWEFKNDGCAMNSQGGTRFSARFVFGRNFDRTSSNFGPQNGLKSELWSDNSAPKIDTNSGPKKNKSKTENRGSKIEIPIVGACIFGSQGPRKWTYLMTKQSKTITSYLMTNRQILNLLLVKSPGLQNCANTKSQFTICC